MSENTQLSTRVITPQGGLDAFTEAYTSLRADLPQTLSLGWRFFVRDVAAMHRQSVLGYLWIVLPPLATSFIWIFLSERNLVKTDTGDGPVPLFILTGTILWTAFNAAVMGMQSILQEARGVLSKVSFPHEALIVSAILKILLNATIPALTLAPAFVVFRTPVTSTACLFPFAFLTLILFGCAAGLITVPISALFTDVGRGIQLALRFGFFVTPVIYALPSAGLVRAAMLANPIAAPLVSGRNWLLGTGEIFPSATVCIFLLSVAMIAVGTMIFKVAIPHLIERLNS